MIWSDMKAIGEDGKIIFESYLEIMYGGYKYFNQEKDFKVKKILGSIWEEFPGEFNKRYCYSGNIFSKMFMGNLIHTSTVILRRCWQLKVGYFDVELKKSGEDYDFHFRTCRLGNVAYLDVPTILYRIGASDQLTTDEYMVWIARNNLKTIRKMFLDAKNEIHLPSPLIRRRFAKSHAWVGTTEFGLNRSSARKHLLRSLCLSPFQGKIIGYLLLSLLPDKVILKLREFRQRLKR